MATKNNDKMYYNMYKTITMTTNSVSTVSIDMNHRIAIATESDSHGNEPQPFDNIKKGMKIKNIKNVKFTSKSIRNTGLTKQTKTKLIGLF